MSNGLTITCAQCGKRHRCPRELSGKRVRCTCGQTMTVPAIASVAAASSGGADSTASRQATVDDAGEIELGFDIDAPARSPHVAASMERFARGGRRISFLGDPQEAEAAVEKLIAEDKPLRAMARFFHTREETYQFYADRMSGSRRGVGNKVCEYCNKRDATGRAALTWRGRFHAGPGTGTSKLANIVARQIGWTRATADLETIEFKTTHGVCSRCGRMLSVRRMIYSLLRAGAQLMWLLGPLALLAAMAMTASSAKSRASVNEGRAIALYLWIAAVVMMSAIWVLPALARLVIGPRQVRTIARNPFEWVATRMKG